MRHGNQPRCDRGQQQCFQNVMNQKQMINAFHLSSLFWTWLEVSLQAPPHFKGLLACLHLPKHNELTDWQPLGPCSWTWLEVSSHAPPHFRGLLACLQQPKCCELTLGPGVLTVWLWSSHPPWVGVVLAVESPLAQAPDQSNQRCPF